MTWTHVPQSLLHRFVDGQIDDEQAIVVALHIDACPACAARATAAEPLARVFASVDDPEPPAALVASIEQQLRGPAPLPGGREHLVAGALLVLGALLFIAAGDPGRAWTALVVLGQALGTVVRTVELPLTLVAPIWAAAAMFTFAAAAMTARRLEPRMVRWR